MIQKSSNYIADYLKKNDKERYYASLVIDKNHRLAVQSLFAFNAEISAIPLRVNEPQSGEIRLQYYSDLLEDKACAETEKNPIAKEFIKNIKKYNLPTVPLVRLIRARRFDLYHDVMPDLQTFEGYAGETSSLLYQYVAIMLNDGGLFENGDAAGHLGVAHALIGHVRSFGFNASRGRIFLPYSIFEKHEVKEQQIFKGQESENLQAAIEEILAIALEHLTKGKEAAKLSPKNIAPAFAFASVLSAQLKLLQRSKISALQSPKSLASWKIILKLAFSR